MRLLEFLRGHAITLCFVITYISATWHELDMPIWHLLIAVVLDFLQRRMCWSLGTKAEAVYRSSLSSEYDHFPRNLLESLREEFPVVMNGMLLALLVIPPAFLHHYSPKVPVVFFCYYTAYLIILLSPFPIFIRAREKADSAELPDGMKLPEYLRQGGSLGGHNMHWQILRHLFLSLPVAALMWALLASKTGYTVAHISGAYFAFFLMLRADQAIYYAKVYFISIFFPAKRD